MGRYGISRSDYKDRLTKQNGLCAICKTDIADYKHSSFSTFSVDHDHETGAVRGLLCQPCNIGLGGFRDNEQFLLSAIKYLRGEDIV